jgi:hypothetical protein
MKSDKEFFDIIKDVYSPLDLVKISKSANVYDRIPGPSETPAQIVSGVIAACCSTVRILGKTDFHYEVATTRSLANKTASGRVLMFAAESYSSSLRYKGFTSVYEGNPYDVYTNILLWINDHA